MIVIRHEYIYRKTGGRPNKEDDWTLVRYSVFTWKLFGFIPLFRTYTPT